MGVIDYKVTFIINLITNIMGYIAGVLIVGILTFGLYSLCELFVRRKERLAMIDKMILNADNLGFIDLPKLSNRATNGSHLGLSIGCLFIGVGLGLFLACMIDISLILDMKQYEESVGWNMAVRSNVSAILYPSLATALGGVGLTVSYIIERKHFLNNKSK